MFRYIYDKGNNMQAMIAHASVLRQYNATLTERDLEF